MTILITPSDDLDVGISAVAFVTAGQVTLDGWYAYDIRSPVLPKPTVVSGQPGTIVSIPGTLIRRVRKTGTTATVSAIYQGGAQWVPPTNLIPPTPPVR
jgi:hypothetical protein